MNNNNNNGQASPQYLTFREFIQLATSETFNNSKMMLYLLHVMPLLATPHHFIDELRICVDSPLASDISKRKVLLLCKSWLQLTKFDSALQNTDFATRVEDLIIPLNAKYISPLKRKETMLESALRRGTRPLPIRFGQKRAAAFYETEPTDEQKTTPLLDLPYEVIASQLHVIDWKYFSELTVEDLVRTGKQFNFQAAMECPHAQPNNLRKKASSHVAQWTIASILNSESYQACLERIRKFRLIAKQLMNKKDLMGFKHVMDGLTSRYVALLTADQAVAPGFAVIYEQYNKILAEKEYYELLSTWQGVPYLDYTFENIFKLFAESKAPEGLIDIDMWEKISEEVSRVKSKQVSYLPDTSILYLQNKILTAEVSLTDLEVKSKCEALLKDKNLNLKK